MSALYFLFKLKTHQKINTLKRVSRGFKQMLDEVVYLCMFI